KPCEGTITDSKQERATHEELRTVSARATPLQLGPQDVAVHGGPQRLDGEVGHTREELFVDPSHWLPSLEVPRGMGRVLRVVVLRETREHGFGIMPIRRVYEAPKDVGWLIHQSTSARRCDVRPSRRGRQPR